MDYEKFFQLISDFLDDELDRDLEREFLENFEDEFCRCYFNTYIKTIELCHEIEIEEIPLELHERLIMRIEKEKCLPYKAKPVRRAKPKARRRIAKRRKTA